ncbi:MULTISPECIES: hypothetical protein [unclassified Chryseobacterium]|uniref:hypothetical protein n=1 Tax=unclassified Chryseobacterium TaxID=2593645 RepID=UPI000D3AF772|nr:MULTISPECIES: hypothetical protein [unclassified Chryseobacterium]PTT77510.1 hypothetical protein DBR25_02820 [Chryseobacterium sp. HMWF001]PVV50842.1 hypothetical protein DD829_21830 [Chryseobacterium sp. HMWF035]
MQELVHHTIQKIQELLEHFNKVQELYLSKSFDFDAQFEEFLYEFLDYLKIKGNTTYESEVLKVMNMISTVKRGFNPVQMEKIASGKRELTWGFSFSAMESVHKFLMEMYTKEHKKLDEAEEILSGLIVSLYQNGILNDEIVKSLVNVPKIEDFWNSLIKQNTQIAGINKKLRLQMISEDIYLLLEKVLLKLN